MRAAIKNSKNHSEIAACEEKPLMVLISEKANFSSKTVLSFSFKIGAKKFFAAKQLAFLLHFLFRRDQNHYSNLTSKIMKMCEQIIKRRQHPNTIQILWIVKNQEKANNRLSYRCAAINKWLSTWPGWNIIPHLEGTLDQQTTNVGQIAVEGLTRT